MSRHRPSVYTAHLFLDGSLGLDSDDTDTIADKHAMDRAGATGTLIRAHAINQGRSADMLPDF